MSARGSASKVGHVRVHRGCQHRREQVHHQALGPNDLGSEALRGGLEQACLSEQRLDFGKQGFARHRPVGLEPGRVLVARVGAIHDVLQPVGGSRPNTAEHGL